jgi:hypothetical protein
MILTSQSKSQLIYEKRLNSKGEPVYEEYKKGKHLGKGGFATCFEVIKKSTNQRMAIKILEKPKEGLK